MEHWAVINKIKSLQANKVIAPKPPSAMEEWRVIDKIRKHVIPEGPSTFCVICASYIKPPWDLTPFIFNQIIFTDRVLKRQHSEAFELLKNPSACAECKTKVREIIFLYQQHLKIKKKLRECVEAIRNQIDKRKNKNNIPPLPPRKEKEKTNVKKKKTKDILKSTTEVVKEKNEEQGVKIADKKPDSAPQQSGSTEDPLNISEPEQFQLEQSSTINCIIDHDHTYHIEDPLIPKKPPTILKTSKGIQQMFKQVKCSDCSKEVPKWGLLRHREICHKDNKKSLNITLKLPRKQDFKLASKLPKKNFPIMYKCNLCSKTMQLSYYKTHKKILHPQVPFPCSKCHKIFCSAKTLKKHVDSVHHKIPGEFPCPTCKKEFQSLAYLNSHFTRFVYHDPDQASRKLRKRIIPEYSGVCESCGKHYNSLAGFKRHQRLVHLKECEFICEKCGKPAFTRLELSRHMEWHTMKEEKERNLVFKFFCEMCEKKFVTSKGFKEHRKSFHEKERNFECELCGKAFFKMIYVKKHMAQMHKRDEADLVCGKCEMRFFRINTLTRHLRRNCRPEENQEGNDSDLEISKLESNYVE